MTFAQSGEQPAALQYVMTRNPIDEELLTNPPPLLIDKPFWESIMMTGADDRPFATMISAELDTVILPVIHASPWTVSLHVFDIDTSPLILRLAGHVLVPLEQLAAAPVIVLVTAAF